MNTHDIELPPLPFGHPTYEFPDGAYDSEQMHQYARAAIEADRKQRSNTKPSTNQDWLSLDPAVAFHLIERHAENWNDAGAMMQAYLDAHIEADRKRRGESVDIRQEVIETLEIILAADWRKWEELASPDEFVRWAKSRANYALSIINEAPQPAEPEYSGWYCAHCKREVDSSEVTFHEQHLECGRAITDDRPPQPTKPLSSNPAGQCSNPETLSSKSAEPTNKDSLSVAEPVKVPSAWPKGTRYKVEPHGDGYAIYRGRDQSHHGLNLAHLTECTEELAKQIEAALNGTRPTP